MARHTVHTLDQRSFGKLKRDHRLVTSQPTHQVVGQSQRTWDHLPLPGMPVQFEFGGFIHSSPDKSLASSEISTAWSGVVGTDRATSTLTLSPNNIRGSQRLSNVERLDVTQVARPCLQLSRGTWEVKIDSQFAASLDPKVNPDVSGSGWVERNELMAKLFTADGDLRGGTVTSGLNPTTGITGGGWGGSGENNHQHDISRRNTDEFDVETTLVVDGGTQNNRWDTRLCEVSVGAFAKLNYAQSVQLTSNDYKGTGVYRLTTEFLVDVGRGDRGLLDEGPYQLIIRAFVRQPAAAQASPQNAHQKWVMATCYLSKSWIILRRAWPIPHAD